MGEFEGQEPAVEGVEGNEGAAPQPNPLEPGGVRFEQVYGKMKDYETRVNQWKEFGDPTAVRDQLAKLKQWEKAVEEQRKANAQTPDEKSEAQRAATIRKELLKVYPELADVQTVKELKAEIEAIRRGASETQTAAVLKDMSTKFSETLKAAKIDAKYQNKIEEYLVSQMSAEERADFVKGNYEVAKRIFDNELKDGLFTGMRSKPNVPAPFTRNTPGGTPPNGKVSKAKTLEEAANEAFSMLKG